MKEAQEQHMLLACGPGRQVPVHEKGGLDHLLTSCRSQNLLEKRTAALLSSPWGVIPLGLQTVKRDPYYDNLRFLLIFLVVAGHVVAYMKTDSVFLRSFFVWVHLFHMPMFVLISGCFSRADGSLRYALQNAGRLLLPYLIFETAALVLVSLRDGGVALDYHLPRNVLWYLVSLFWWRLMLPYAVRFRRALPASILVSLLCGYCRGAEWHFSLSRTLVFFPFFLTGYYLRNGMQKTIRRAVSAHAAVTILVVSFLLSFFLMRVPVHWFYGATPYAAMGHAEWYAGVYRALVIGAAFLVGFAFLRLVPGTVLSITEWGSRTLYVFLLHDMIVLTALERLGVFKRFDHPLRQTLGILSLSVLITVVLSSDFVMRVTMPAVDPVTFARRVRDRIAKKARSPC